MGGFHLEIKHSNALRYFKNEIGQANHMLITIMVGLDGIVPYHIEASSEFHTAWNPKSKEYSVQRSKVYAKKASLAWLVDCLDMYLRLINQAPILICRDDLKYQIDSIENSRSVYRRMKLICSYYSIQSTNYALVDLLICWRNKLTHFQAENDILESSKDILLNNTSNILSNHCGLEIASTLKSFDQTEVPSFKEVASFVKATIDLVYEIDKSLIDDIDQVKYADSIIIKYLSNKTRLNNIFSKDQQTAEKSIKQILFQNGFSANTANDVDLYCECTSKLSYKEAKCKLEAGTFISDEYKNNKISCVL